ncbi:AAA family ATPase [Micromonospora echinofusca]|uniref:AAA family ATPase n=1 Tax=Micromonospora echinofusca TaxID=47858 RepID=UPI0033E41193
MIDDEDRQYADAWDAVRNQPGYNPNAPVELNGRCLPQEQPPGESAAQPARRVRLLAASTIKPKRVRWLWDGRVPVGEITLVAGREGSGKSTFLAWMVRAITRGELPGEFYGLPRAVLYAAAEDSWSYTVVPRLIAADADLNLVYRVEVDDLDHGQARMTLPKDTADVMKAGAEVDAVVLMLDPGLSFLDDKIDTYRTPEVRPALEALRRHAEGHGLSVVMLCHFNKGQGTDVLTKIAGSRAFAEVARAALAVAVDDPDEGEGEEQDQTAERVVILSQAKNNLGRMDQPNLTYAIRDSIVETDDGDTHVGRLHWTGESRRTAEQALNGGGHSKRKPLGDTAQMITNYLRAQNGRAALAEIIQALPDVPEGTSKKELRRMVEREQLAQPGRGIYALPGYPFEAATSATSATLPAHTHSLIDDDESRDATSATSESGKVAEVAKVAGGQGQYRAGATFPTATGTDAREAA